MRGGYTTVADTRQIGLHGVEPSRLRSWRIWTAGALVLLLVEAANIAQIQLTGRSRGPLTAATVFSDLFYWFSWFAVSPLAFKVSRRFRLDRPSLVNVAAHFAAAPALFALAALLRTLARWPFFGFPEWGFLIGWRYAFVFSIPTFLLLYIGTVMLYYALEYYHAFHSRELRASQLETMIVRAQLDALRNQLQPHFLFNTLHAISALMSKDVPAARRMMTRLSDILRLALDEPEQHEVTLAQELRFLEQFLDLQRMRFGERLQVDLDVDARALDCLVPRLILQPLVENALTHGIGSRAGAGRLGIAAALDDATLHLAVTDDGPGLASGRDELMREGVGLRNTRARLMHLYGDLASLELTDMPAGGLRVAIAIPDVSARSGTLADAG
jgi:two-component system, LytTR family, sensor kinase